ncbi:hypothetical protein PAXRUDRAFT_712126 [Paxillus rubicundulus Ve08.2h10]|uniref:Uncharacterized protein n=1 Tax=Paxillus rubicundulus Ve08.2h10 TaxID=930991 RepID=A0A0D0ED70_9AGAM|nr:hypothetical protein PAXRUDRAFT_712126 [Paxillus rubicundulus Ve08.2h10]
MLRLILRFCAIIVLDQPGTTHWKRHAPYHSLIFLSCCHSHRIVHIHRLSLSPSCNLTPLPCTTTNITRICPLRAMSLDLYNQLIVHSYSYIPRIDNPLLMTSFVDYRLIPCSSQNPPGSSVER